MSDNFEGEFKAPGSEHEANQPIHLSVADVARALPENLSGLASEMNEIATDQCAKAGAAGLLAKWRDQERLPAPMYDVLVDSLDRCRDGYDNYFDGPYPQHPSQLPSHINYEMDDWDADEKTPPVETTCPECHNDFQLPAAIHARMPGEWPCDDCLPKTFVETFGRVLSKFEQLGQEQQDY